MAERLTELGYASDKVFAISTAQGGLHVPTDYAGDMPVGQQTTPGVGWWYHVAPVIHVRDAQGNVREMVIDPSLASGPITIDSANWIGFTSSFKDSTFAPASASRLSLIGVGP